MTTYAHGASLQVSSTVLIHLFLPRLTAELLSDICPMRYAGQTNGHPPLCPNCDKLVDKRPEPGGPCHECHATCEAKLDRSPEAATADHACSLQQFGLLQARRSSMLRYHNAVRALTCTFTLQIRSVGTSLVLQDHVLLGLGQCQLVPGATH